MPSFATRRGRRLNEPAPAVDGMERWKLEDAKARLSELVREAGAAGPQLVTVRGKEAAVVIAPDDYERLLPRRKRQKPLVNFLQGLGLADLKIERERDRGRDIDL